MEAVDTSNRTKFCATQEEVDATVEKYSDLGVSVYVDGEFPMKRVKVTVDQVDINGKDGYRCNKMLKCVKFQEPVFIDL